MMLYLLWPLYCIYFIVKLANISYRSYYKSVRVLLQSMLFCLARWLRVCALGPGQAYHLPCREALAGPVWWTLLLRPPVHPSMWHWTPTHAPFLQERDVHLWRGGGSHHVQRDGQVHGAGGQGLLQQWVPPHAPSTHKHMHAHSLILYTLSTRTGICRNERACSGLVIVPLLALLN